MTYASRTSSEIGNPALAVPTNARPARGASAFGGLKTESSQKSIALALQGGGAHGAFTWGVLDALIEDGRLGFEAITGASAGAMSAVVMVDGWLNDGPDGAQAALEKFWRHTSLDGDLWPVPRNVLNGILSAWKQNPLAAFWLRAMNQSPYIANPLNINPLKRALEAAVDFERVRSADKVGLFVSATNVWTGKLTVFERSELTADHLMASACLPTVFQAVEIDGVPYWDGGYLGNPALYPLHETIKTRDILVVQINPVERRETPKTPKEIQNRLNEITFNANLMRELRAIDFIHGLIEEGKIGEGEFQHLLIHRIDGTDALEDHDAASRSDTRWRVLLRLRDKGRDTAKAWLNANYDSIGQRCTLNLRTAYR